MTYTKEQLVKALQEQWVHLFHDDYVPGDELYTSPEEHLEWLQGLSYEELVAETTTDLGEWRRPSFTRLGDGR